MGPPVGTRADGVTDGDQDVPDRCVQRGKRVVRVAVVVFFAGVFLVCLLSGPAATWLQERGRWVPGAGMPDAVYLVAGSRHQDRRCRALTNYLRGLPSRAARPTPLPRILVGNDQLVGGWSREDQRNLTRGEWAAKKLAARAELYGWGDGSDDASGALVQIVPGTISCTDDEMACLAAFVRAQPEIRSIALATSPFHVRRAIARLEHHLGAGFEVYAVPIAQHWTDRAPWTVALELVKLARENLRSAAVRLRPSMTLDSASPARKDDSQDD